MFRDKDYVYEVYRELSFSKAASRLYISQPSLSAKIKKIEENLGAVIFDRSTSPLRLTEFGKSYIEAIEEVYRIERRVEGIIDDIEGLRSGELSIGAGNVYAAYVLPPIIARFKSKFPNVNIRLVEGSTSSIGTLLANNEIDMVIDNTLYDAELYERHECMTENILLAVPKSFQECENARDYALRRESLVNKDYLSDKIPAVPLSIFKSVPFVLLTPNNDTRSRSERICRESGFRPIVALEVDQHATAYMIASTGMGATFASDTVIEKLPSYESLVYYKLQSALATRTVCLTLKRHKQKNCAIEELLKIVNNE